LYQPGKNNQRQDNKNSRTGLREVWIIKQRKLKDKNNRGNYFALGIKPFGGGGGTTGGRLSITFGWMGLGKSFPVLLIAPLDT